MTALLKPSQEDLDAAHRFYGRVTTDLITIVDQQGRFLYLNPAAEQLYGLESAQASGRSAFDHIHPEDRAATRAAFEKWVGDRQESIFHFENRQVSDSGAVRHLRWTIAPLRRAGGGVECLISHATDVTALVEAALHARREEIRHRSLLKGVLDPTLTIDAQGIVREVSDSVETVFGYRPEELLGQNVALLMPEPHRSQHDGYLERYRRTGETGILNRTRAFSVVKKDGSLIDCELSVSRVEIPGEPGPLFVGSFRDVTARLRAERALAASEARMRAIFDQEFQLVWLLAPDGTVREANHRALESIGARREDVVGRPFWETPWWPTPEAQRRVRAEVANAALGRFVRFEAEQRTRLGEPLFLDLSLKPIRDEHGQVQFLLPEGRDITLLKQSQARENSMLRSLAAVGESASVLAHEIKNPLTAINLALRAVADRLGEDQKSVLEDLAGRLAKLEHTLRRTLSFARPLDLERSPCRVEELFGDVAHGLGPELDRARVELSVGLPAGLPEVRVDRGLIGEVLTNLVRNALEACPAGSRVRLSARRGGDGRLELRVEDDGPGVAPSLREQIFKPFVTSKAQGTGLGLAICRKIVEEHGGAISAGTSDLGGASFCIQLPLRA